MIVDRNRHRHGRSHAGEPTTPARRRPLVALLATVAAAIVSSGCGPTLEFEYLESPPPNHAIVEADHIAVRLGTAVGVRVTNGGTQFDDDVELMMTSEAPEVIAVEPSLESDEFVLWGASMGSTVIHVELDGDLWESVSADVYR